MNEFLELVVERPDPLLWKRGQFCPFCNSENIQSFGTSSTLVGYFGEDMNHTWTKCKCNDCHKDFTIETKGRKNVWFTANSKILLGIPYCFEGYVYTCKHCGGDVVRHHYNINDDKETTFTSFTISNVVGEKAIPQQYCEFECKVCHEKIRTENSNYCEYES
jgi:hypothetical protein